LEHFSSPDLKPGRRVAQYVRMSTEYQRYSIENQIEAIKEYADQHGLEVVRTYSDAGRSGLTIAGRAALLQLIKDVQSGPDFQAILVYDVSRWGRFQDVDESAHYEYVCRTAGVPVYYCAENFGSSSSPTDALLKTIKRIMAGEYSRELSAKVVRAHRRLAGMGFRQGAVPGFGLRRLSVDEENQPKRVLHTGENKSFITDRVTLASMSDMDKATVRFIFTLLVHHLQSPQRIADILNMMAISATDGVAWTRMRVYWALTNENYIGNYVYGRTACVLHRRRSKSPADKWIRAEGVFEPIVDKHLFNKAKEILAFNAARHHPAQGRLRPHGALAYSPRPFKTLLHPHNHSGKRDITESDIEVLQKRRVKDNGYRFYRVDNKSAGWVVRISIEGKVKSQYFSDQVYGSSRAARAAAQQEGLRNREIHRELLILRRTFYVRSSSTTGVSGVSRSSERVRRNAHYMAYWIDPTSGKRMYSRFYVHRLGENEALRQAICAREKATEPLRERMAEIFRQLEGDKKATSDAEWMLHGGVPVIAAVPSVATTIAAADLEIDARSESSNLAFPKLAE
jgi:DNA invertase Pin-like site-specific DNA recombinase